MCNRLKQCVCNTCNICMHLNQVLLTAVLSILAGQNPQLVFCANLYSRVTVQLTEALEGACFKAAAF